MAIVNLSFNIPTGFQQRILDAFANGQGYSGVDLGGNPETKLEFLKRKIADMIKGVVILEERRVAREAADAAAKTTAETDIVIS